FVHQLADERLTDADILADPVAKIAAVGGSRHPAIPLPRDLFEPTRGNSQGLDLADREELERVAAVVSAPESVRPERSRGALAQSPDGRPSTTLGTNEAVTSTGDHWQACAAEAKAMISRAVAAFPAWDAQPVEHRAACLDRLADLLEQE